MPQCPECSTLDWSDVIAEAARTGKPTPEHHPRCMAQIGQIFKPTTPSGEQPVWWGNEDHQSIVPDEDREAARRMCEKYVEIYSQAKPTTEINATVNCRLCGLHYEVKLEVPHGSKSVRWACPQCEHKICVWFDEQDAIDDLEASLHDYRVTSESIATMSLDESSGTFILCPKCGNHNSFDPDARLSDCYCPKCGAAPYYLA